MLDRLCVSNVAIAENLEIHFKPGFTVLTGETGAGKSILIDALSLSLGMPARQELIRSGEKKAFVEAHFLMNENHLLKNFLKEQQFDGDGGDSTLILSREFQKERGSLCRLNGQSVSLAILKKTAQVLVDIHGQHEHQTLFQTESHIEYLDAYAGKKALSLRADVAGQLYELRRHEKELEELNEKERVRVRRLDMANYELSEITSARCEPGEDEKLQQRISLHQHQEKLLLHAKEAYRFLSEEGHACLLSGSREIQAVCDIDKRLTGVKEFLDSALAHLEEAVSVLRDYQNNLEFDTDSFQKDMERYEVLRNLKRKYGGTIEDVLTYKEKLESEINELTSLDERKEELEKITSSLKKKLMKNAVELSELRKKTAQKLQSTVRKELCDLGIPEARFIIKITPSGTDDSRMTAWGLDDVEFLFSANPGEEVKPLTRIASGGEISRVMLALKTALSKQDPVPVLVFDEIDAGIGGETAVKVARKLSYLSQTHQIICITHLAIIASRADTHIQVRKTVDGGKTLVTAKTLAPQERVSEIARMLRGEGKSATTLKDAQELIQSAQHEKKKSKP